MWRLKGAKLPIQIEGLGYVTGAEWTGPSSHAGKGSRIALLIAPHTLRRGRDGAKRILEL
jgi:hypothetical protein